MDLFETAVDPKKEVEGARVKVDDTTTLIIARFNNPKFRSMQANLMEPYIRKQGKKGATTVEAEEILNKCLVKCVLLGWEGLYIKGREIPYSRDVAMKILSDARFADFKERVMFESQTLENFRLEAMEDDLGNSPESSSTTPAGQTSNASSSKA